MYVCVENYFELKREVAFPSLHLRLLAVDELVITGGPLRFSIKHLDFVVSSFVRFFG